MQKKKGETRPSSPGLSLFHDEIKESEANAPSLSFLFLPRARARAQMLAYSLLALAAFLAALAAYTRLAISPGLARWA